ncbi:hypothetical protein BGZ73_004542 [Actinomortierella ambigua]|nr:hypothetical protein BGZ73_004542 [Actinomortierella ambigua]
MAIIGLALPALYQSGRSAEHRSNANAILTQRTEKGTLYNGFVYKPCVDTMSFGYTWFTNIFNVVCDRQDKSPMCNLRIKSSSGYSSLGEKSLNLWKLVQRAPKATEIIVKLDDDTIIQKHVLDAIIDDFASKPCVLGGLLHSDGGWYWPLGRLYMFKKSALPPPNSPLWLANGDQYRNAEDVQMGYLINVTDPKLICQIDPAKFWHGNFVEATPGWDKRVEIKFSFISSSCDGGGWF